MQHLLVTQLKSFFLETLESHFWQFCWH